MKVERAACSLEKRIFRHWKECHRFRVCLSKTSFKGNYATSDGLTSFGGPGSLPITGQPLQLGHSAPANYTMLIDKKTEKEDSQKQLP